MEQLELGQYPESPGSKTGGTSKAAANKIKSHASAIKARCLKALKMKNFTADELADFLNEDFMNVRPRVSQLFKQGLIEDTGITRPSRSGTSATVYRAKYQDE